MLNYQVYCLSFNNPERRENMIKRFNHVNINCIFNSGVSMDDDRMAPGKGGNSCMYGHLDMITDFYNSDKEIGIFCEDDICIHKDLSIILPEVIEDFKIMSLDIILLGYLLPYKISNPNSICNTTKYNYYNYDDELWGTQMYMLSKSYAKYIIDTYSTNYAESSIINTNLIPFSADWTITKDTLNRAIIYPMLALEDGKKIYNHEGQQNFHDRCHNEHFDPNIFII